jgi:hypothetical protein
MEVNPLALHLIVACPGLSLQLIQSQKIILLVETQQRQKMYSTILSQTSTILLLVRGFPLAYLYPYATMKKSP